MASDEDTTFSPRRNMNNIFGCSVCDKIFPAFAKLVNHERIHTGEKPFVCKMCSRAFRQAVHLKRHLKVHTDQRPHECGSCDTAFKLKAHLRRHTKSHHSYKLDESGQPDTPNHEELVDENGDRVKPGERVKLQYKCQVCSKIFKRRYNLIMHQRTHAENHVFKCDICAQGFPELQAMAVHRKTHDAEEESNIKGIKTTCPKKKIHTCGVCGAEFKQPRSLASHHKIHTDVANYNCEFCDKWFFRPSDLTMHRRTHTGERPFPCGVCDKAFKQKAHVAKHKETVHGINGNNNIPINLKGVRNNKRRFTKLRSKSEVKPENVEDSSEWDNKFAAQNGTHTENVNGLTSVKAEQGQLDETPSNNPQPNHNACDTCGNVFTQKSYLVVHKRIHTGEMPYDCDICGTAFRQRSHMKKHQETMHNVFGSSARAKLKVNPKKVIRTKAGIPPKTDTGAETVIPPKTETRGKIVLPPKTVIPPKTETRGKIVMPPKTVIPPNGQETYGKRLAKVDDHVLISKPRPHPAGTSNSRYSGKAIPQGKGSEEQNSHDKPKKKPRIYKKKPFQCEVCYKKFRQKTYLHVHKRIHTGEMPYKCDICHRPFRQKTHVVKHKQTVHKMRQVNRQDIQKNVEQSEDFIKDETENHQEESEETYVSKTTPDENFTSEYSMVGDKEIFGSPNNPEMAVDDNSKCDQSSASGVTSCATAEKPHACEICGKAFKRKAYLAIHRRMHTGERPYKCLECPLSFRQDNHLRVHMGRIHPDGYAVYQAKVLKNKNLTFKCRFCSREYKRMHLLKQHVRIHHNQGRASRDYNQGGASSNQGGASSDHTQDRRSSKSPKSVSPHLSKIDGKDKPLDRPYQCPFCPKSFKLRQHFITHERVHTGARPFPCVMCDKAFKQSSHLYRHIKSHHAEKEPIVGEEAGEQTAPEDELYPHKCTACTKTFKSRKGLRIHFTRCNFTKELRVKKGRFPKKPKTNADLPYKCKQCGKRFDRKQILRVHERVHSGEKPYTCDECGKAFAIAGNLQRHKVTHTGQKPYVCDICGKGCTQKSNVEAHMRLVHGVIRKVSPVKNPQREEKRNLLEESRHWSSSTVVKREREENGFGIYEDNNNCYDMPSMALNGLNIKEEVKHPSEELYRCCECGAGFGLESSMMKHCLEAH